MEYILTVEVQHAPRYVLRGKHDVEHANANIRVRKQASFHGCGEGATIAEFLNDPSFP